MLLLEYPQEAALAIRQFIGAHSFKAE
jgi:hypothetical protein